ncbi:hypothetical protein NQ318_016530 [Aromia moschata]|uniref:PH domain-containing protein n=1 Tax=Aromia moschata TaxID=1265417 RepID=A0AAV8YZ89_9CUCU|nr:hypothetical protein NQ318_016530 [Aromia moschata]
MDSFTENILARARERQRMLKGYTGNEKIPLRETNEDAKANSEPNLTDIQKIPRKEIASDPDMSRKIENIDNTFKENKSESILPRIVRQNSKTRVSSELPGSPKTQLKTLNIQKENFNMEIKVSSKDNVRVEVEIEEQDDSDTGSHTSESGLRDESKYKLKRLGKLYAGGDEAQISSPIHRTEAQFCSGEETVECSNKKRKEVSESNNRSRKGLSGLASLAQTINQWENESCPNRENDTKFGTPKKTWKPPAPMPPTILPPPKSSPPKPSQKAKAPDPQYLKGTALSKGSPRKNENKAADVGSASKQLKWDQKEKDSNADVKIAQTAQLAKAPVESRYETIVEETEECHKDNKIRHVAAAFEHKNTAVALKSPVKSGAQKEKTVVCPKSPLKGNVMATNIANKAAIFEASPSKSAKDPALLSVSERKALFEKNRGDALVPKAAFAMSAPVKVETTMKASSTKIITDENIKPSKYPAPKPPIVAETSPTVAAVQQAGGIASKMAALLENKSTISQEQIENNIKQQRQKEMDMLLNRFNRNKEVTNEVIQEVLEEDDDEVDATEETAMITEKAAKIVGKSSKPGEKTKKWGETICPIVTAVLEDVKRIKVSPPKAGRLYPSLSDIEATNTETDTRTPSPDNNSSFEESYESDDPNTSFGREILQAVCKNQTQQKRPIYDESTASDVSSILDDMDNYLDDLSNEDNTSIGPTPPKQVRQGSAEKATTQPSNSFNYKNYSPNVSNTPKSKFQSPVKIRTSPKKSIDLPTHVVEGDDLLPLTHTVSFYRKQQNQAHTPVTPVRQVTRQPLIEECSSKDRETQEAARKKIAELQEEVVKQQNIISQTSQALNLCSSTPEFSGSTEQVEAERVLLVATHRRQAASHELQRLRVEGTLRPQGQHAQNVPPRKGHPNDIQHSGGKGHHVVCLVKCGEQVVPTKLVSTVVSNVKNPDADLCIPGTVTLNNIYSDFTITFEVYCLQAQEEFLPHEIKYHINNKKSTNKLTTPKKSKQESRMIMPIKESPAGPQAVRTSSFALMGYVVFSIRAVNKKVWSLNNTPSMSPLDGTVAMRISCELAVSVEHRGFLTMFEDVSGFGAWHRRWCLLKGHALSYWKYPDDEKKMAPIDTIDLKKLYHATSGPRQQRYLRQAPHIPSRERKTCPSPR